MKKSEEVKSNAKEAFETFMREDVRVKQIYGLAAYVSDSLPFILELLPKEMREILLEAFIDIVKNSVEKRLKDIK